MELEELLEIAKQVGDIAETKGHDSILEWAISVYTLTASNLNEKPKKPWEK